MGNSHGRLTTDKPLAYNLVLTASFLLVVPRRTPAHEGIEVNSIGFIGSFFERNDEQLAFFQTHGGLQLLAHVGFPPVETK
jgi:sulfate adenylyltransferase (ADP) / ATP adenylyltransferase